MSKKKFTVIGYYDEVGQRFNHHVMAHDGDQAAAVAVRELVKADGCELDGSAADMVIVDVVEGHHQSCFDQDGIHCVYGCDVPEIQQELSELEELEDDQNE
jgi:hypothetical protein